MLRSTTEELRSVPVYTVVDDVDVEDLSPCHRRYTFGATCDVTKYRRSGAAVNSHFNHADERIWFTTEFAASKRAQVGHNSYHSSSHHGIYAAAAAETPSSLFMPASGHGIRSPNAFVETDENRMLTSSSSSSSSSPQSSSIAVHHRASVGVARSAAPGRCPSSPAGMVRPTSAATRPIDLDLRSTVFDDDGEYRRRTYSMPTGGGGGGQLHSHAGVTVSSAAARSAACRRAYTRKLRDEQLQQQQQQQQQQRSCGNNVTSGDGGGRSGASSAGFDGLTEYVRVRYIAVWTRCGISLRVSILRFEHYYYYYCFYYYLNSYTKYTKRTDNTKNTRPCWGGCGRGCPSPAWGSGVLPPKFVFNFRCSNVHLFWSVEIAF